VQLDIQKYLYDINNSIDDVIIWGIISKQLPILKEQVVKLLEE